MLVRAGKITPEQLDQALEKQKNSGEKFVDILLNLGAIADEDELTHFIGRQLNIGASSSRSTSPGASTSSPSPS